MYKIESDFSFEAAHRLYDVDTYSEECRDNLHGHSYKLHIEVCRNSLNPAGMVMDFKFFKKIVNDVIIDKFDHSCILRDTDPIYPVIKENCSKVHCTSESPTAEWMCKHFYDLLSKQLLFADPDLFVSLVKVQETENNVACYSPLEQPRVVNYDQSVKEVPV